MSAVRNHIEFHMAFRGLTGFAPFPWQQRLYTEFAASTFPPSCVLPTGLGKTSVIAVWLVAWANEPTKVPRRLVYVVNRRTVVDQSTTEAEKLQKNATSVGISKPAISTLRGELADNAKWSADPARPAIIVGTVDLIGSALLFSSYRAGRSRRPLQAGFLGQDALLVHDEAHLEPAFQRLIERIRIEQERDGSNRVKPFHVMALTATPPSSDTPPFELNNSDLENEIIRSRVHAKKTIRFHPIADDKKDTADAVAKLALEHKDSGQAILIYVRLVSDAKAVAAKLEKRSPTKLLIGPLRGRERDELARSAVFARFLQPSDRKSCDTPQEGTVYLVCTSAGEVGVNISADHLVCDLTPFDSMAQRFGRVNRFGGNDEAGNERNAFIDVVHPTKFDATDKYDEARQRTLELLNELPSRGDKKFSGSPGALGGLSLEKRIAAFTPPPTVLEATDILFDSWALTSITGQLPGRPPVDEYLHGVAEDNNADTHFAWREEVGLLDDLPALPPDALKERIAEIEEYLDEYPLKTHELLRERTATIRLHTKDIAKRAPDLPVWILDNRSRLQVITTAALAELEFRDLVARTVILPPKAGGLREGILDGKAPYRTNAEYDVADAFPNAKQRSRVRFLWTLTDADTAESDSDESDAAQSERVTNGPWRRLGVGPAIEFPDGENGRLPGMTRLPDIPLSRDDEESVRRIVAFVRPESADDDETRSRQSRVEQKLEVHLQEAEKHADRFASALLPENLRLAVRLAARWHDLGKDRRIWQLGIGNAKYASGHILAKSGHGRRIKGLEGYRHEFGSLMDVLDPAKPHYAEFAKLSDDMQQLVLHLIAAHHGRGRPHFPAGKNEAFDPDATVARAESVAAEVPRRFARLQRKYGRWGLAYLESLLRAADWAASANPSEYLPEGRS